MINIHQDAIYDTSFYHIHICILSHIHVHLSHLRILLYYIILYLFSIISSHIYIYTYMHTYRQTDIQTDRHTDIQRDIHTYSMILIPVLIPFDSLFSHAKVRCPCLPPRTRRFRHHRSPSTSEARFEWSASTFGKVGSDKS
jgi:hypothetical protein